MSNPSEPVRIEVESVVDAIEETKEKVEPSPTNDTDKPQEKDRVPPDVTG